MKMLKRFVKRLLSCLLLAALFVLVVIGGTLGVQGWRLYRATAAQKPIASLYDEISSRPGFASCDQLPQTYIDAVISVEDSRFERHHGIDPAAIVRALWADLRTRSLAEGGSTPVSYTHLKAAKAHGVKISCDLNYRGKLWTREQARAAMTDLCQYVDVCISNEEDAKDVFGIEAEATDIYGGKLNAEGYKSVAKQLADKFHFEKVAITLRESCLLYTSRCV